MATKRSTPLQDRWEAAAALQASRTDAAAAGAELQRAQQQLQCCREEARVAHSAGSDAQQAANLAVEAAAAARQHDAAAAVSASHAHKQAGSHSGTQFTPTCLRSRYNGEAECSVTTTLFSNSRGAGHADKLNGAHSLRWRYSVCQTMPQRSGGCRPRRLRQLPPALRTRRRPQRHEHPQMRCLLRTPSSGVHVPQPVQMSMSHSRAEPTPCRLQMSSTLIYLATCRQRAAAAEGFAASFRRRMAAHAAEPELAACSDANMQVGRRLLTALAVILPRVIAESLETPSVHLRPLRRL